MVLTTAQKQCPAQLWYHVCEFSLVQFHLRIMLCVLSAGMVYVVSKITYHQPFVIRVS